MGRTVANMTGWSKKVPSSAIAEARRSSGSRTFGQLGKRAAAVGAGAPQHAGERTWFGLGVQAPATSSGYPLGFEIAKGRGRMTGWQAAEGKCRIIEMIVRVRCSLEEEEIVSLRKSWFVLIAVAALGLVGCARSLHQTAFASAKPVTDWGGVENLSQDGGVYFGGQPTADALETAQKRGVRVVVNLCVDREMQALEFDEAALVQRLGMEYVRIPVALNTFGPTDADDLKDVVRRTSGPVLIHCASSSRAGAIWAMYLHRHRGVALDDAIELGRKAGLRSQALVETIRESADCRVGRAAAGVR